MSSSSQPMGAIEEVVDVVGDVIGDIAEDVGEIAEEAVAAAADVSVVGIRLVTRSVRFVARHPREVLIGVGLVAAALAVLGYLKSSNTSDADAA